LFISGNLVRVCLVSFQANFFIRLGYFLALFAFSALIDPGSV
jgi:hypothetical protein